MEVKEWWLDAWGRRCWACSRYVCRHEQLHLPVCMDPVGAGCVLLQVHTTHTVKEQSDERLKANDFFLMQAKVKKANQCRAAANAQNHHAFSLAVLHCTVLCAAQQSTHVLRVQK